MITYPIKSSRPTPNIQRLAYDEYTQTAQVTFQNSQGVATSTWEYWPLPPEFMDRWAAAESTTKFFNSNVKGAPGVQSRKAS